MLQTYQLTKELFHLILRVPKDEAYFVYFTFESNEGLAYYSTVDESLKGQFRDIDLKSPIEMKEAVINLIAKLQTEIRLDILVEEVILDS